MRTRPEGAGDGPYSLAGHAGSRLSLSPQRSACLLGAGLIDRRLAGPHDIHSIHGPPPPPPHGGTPTSTLAIVCGWSPSGSVSHRFRRRRAPDEDALLCFHALPIASSVGSTHVECQKLQEGQVRPASPVKQPARALRALVQQVCTEVCKLTADPSSPQSLDARVVLTEHHRLISLRLLHTHAIPHWATTSLEQVCKPTPWRCYDPTWPGANLRVLGLGPTWESPLCQELSISISMASRAPSLLPLARLPPARASPHPSL